MLYVFLFNIVVNQNIININNTKIVQIFFKNIIDEMLLINKNVAQIKKHY